MKEHYDVAIIGAGPAGTSCALSLRNAGLSVALIDKSKFPRNKTCGDAIPGPALKFLKEIHPDIVQDFRSFEYKQQIQSSLLYLSNGESLEIKWKTEAYNSQRFHFDDFLLSQVKKHTQTKIYEGLRIKSITQTPQAIRLISSDPSTSISCQMLIGSDGAHSIVSKNLRQKKTENARKALAISAVYKNLQVSTISNEFYLLKKIPGYFWIFPVGDNAFNVGYGVFKQQKAKTPNLKRCFQEIISEHPIISKKFRGASIQSKLSGFLLPLGGQKHGLSGERFLLTGDAANLIDPLSGHGIDKAIKSGILAAQQIEKCFQEKDFSHSFNKTYDAAIYTIYGQELKRNFRVMKLLFHFPWIIRLLSPFIKRNQNLFHKLYYFKKRMKASTP